MEITNLKTPAFLLDLERLENNILRMSSLAQEHNKVIVPMTKTHKSTEIAKMQQRSGAIGFLVGTLDEAIDLVHMGAKEITLAYPFIGQAQLEIIHHLAKKTKLTLSCDTYEAMEIYETFLASKEIFLDYLLIINTGLNRFGIAPGDVVEFVDVANLKYPHLRFLGLATHPGHVYGVTNGEEIIKIAKESAFAMESAVQSLFNHGIKCEVVATGSTPTFNEDLHYPVYNVLRPGNYVFYDAIQLSLGVTDESNCALTVLATIISKQNNRFIIDCGSKCLGLDKGAHGNNLIKGYGKVVGHDELILISLSEEVGIIEAIGETTIKIGDKIRIIPNHSCSCANLTSFLYGIKENKVIKIINVDMRENSKIPEMRGL